MPGILAGYSLYPWIGGPHHATPRPPGAPGIPWHIIQRGNNRTACFHENSDDRYFLEILAEQAAKYQCCLHAGCLMTNHVHQLLTPAAAHSPTLLMKHLGQRYVPYINRTYQRSSTLWEGPF
ncbi:MAG: transposase, partial [Gammaproteobacteria bacterium]